MANDNICVSWFSAQQHIQFIKAKHALLKEKNLKIVTFSSKRSWSDLVTIS